MNPNTMPLQTMNIYKYCNTASRSAHGSNPYNSPCVNRNIAPLSKTSNLNTSTNDSSENKKMSYSRWVSSYGTGRKFNCS